MVPGLWLKGVVAHGVVEVSGGAGGAVEVVGAWYPPAVCGAVLGGGPVGGVFGQEGGHVGGCGVAVVEFVGVGHAAPPNMSSWPGISGSVPNRLRATSARRASTSSAFLASRSKPTPVS